VRNRWRVGEERACSAQPAKELVASLLRLMLPLSWLLQPLTAATRVPSRQRGSLGAATLPRRIARRLI
jgi:hypothetical protein